MTTHVPDDEALSAHLDREGDTATAAHVATCRACAARLAELQRVAARVHGAVAPPDPATRRSAIDAALAATSRLGDVTPLRSRRRVPTWIAAAAAAVAVALAAIPALLDASDGGEHTAAHLDAAAAPRGPMVTDQLGDQSDPEALAAVLRDRLANPTATADSQASFGAEAGGASGAEAGEASGAAAGAGGRAATSKEGLSRDAAAPPSEAAVPVEPAQPCADEARAAGADRVGALLYSAFLQWRGTAAVVYVFEAPDPKAETLTRRAFVMARRDCRLLVAPSF